MISPERAGNGSVAGLKKRLEARQSVIGAFLALRSSDTAELMAQAGFDFLIVDAEHSSIGPADILEMIRAIGREDAAPLVRVAETEASHVQWALDAGATGILFPRSRSVEDVHKAVSLCRYPPDGIRGLGPGRASRYGAKLLDYAATANEDVSVMIQIETLEAVERIADIVGVPGVDLIFVGPGDLSQLLGVAGQFLHPCIQEIGKQVVSECRKRNIPVGTLALDDESFAFWSDLGVRLFVVGSDASFLIHSCRESVDRLRRMSQ